MAKQEINLTANLGTIFATIKHDVDDLYELAESIEKSMQTLSVESAVNGRFIRVGVIGYYVLNSAFVVDHIPAKSYMVLDDIPSNYAPIISCNRMAIVNNAQLTESLLIRIDYQSNKVKLMNTSTSDVRDITLLNSSYNYIINSDELKKEEASNYPDWENISSPDDQATKRPEWIDLED